jgi:hypothetical protein
MANANTERAALWRQLKELGWASDRPFVKYSLEDLRAEVELFSDPGTPVDQPLPGLELPAFELPDEPTVGVQGPGPIAPPSLPGPAAPVVAGPDPNEMPGQRLNTQGDEPIRVDEFGRAWYQEEVLKPSYPKPRGRRVLRYQETGVEQVTVQNGEYTETFEVAGSGPGQAAEVKITLPSYQVGIFKDPRFPFKIHTYNGNEGFDLFEVEEFFGGSELVPETVKRMYVENHLCYDIRSVVRTIEAEHRQLQLTGRI